MKLSTLWLKSNLVPWIAPVLAVTPAVTLPALPQLADAASVCQTETQSEVNPDQDIETAGVEIKTISDFRSLLKDEGVDAATEALQQLMQNDSSFVYAAVASIALHHIQNGRDYDAAVEAWRLGYDYYYARVDVAEEPEPTDINYLGSTASAIASYSRSSASYKETGTAPMLSAIKLLLPSQTDLEEPNGQSMTMIRLIRQANSLAPDESKNFVQEWSELTRQWFENNPEDVQSNLAFLQTQAITSQSASDLVELHEMALERFPTDGQVFTQYQNTILTAASSMLNDDPDTASEMLKILERKAEASEALDEAARKRAMTAITRTVNRIQPALNRMKLIGKPAPMFDAEAWVNGEEVTTQDLKGKVVLLDFWAVWCGPCIATFPHLREWNEEFGDKGLVIVGVTSQYNYHWDDEANRASRGEEQSMDEEVAMLKQFLAHHELEHRTMVNPADSLMKKEYGVSGIPQAVLIDQQGNVRMIRVGSGQKNADELHKMIKVLLENNQT